MSQRLPMVVLLRTSQLSGHLKSAVILSESEIFALPAAHKLTSWIFLAEAYGTVALGTCQLVDP